MIARLQRFAVVLIIASSLASLSLFIQHGNVLLGILSVFVISFAYAPVIAVELMMLAFVCGRSKRPPMISLICAWWTEVKVAPLVFYWQQPFRSHALRNVLPAQPDGRTAVLLVHGYLCNRGFWNPWMKRLESAGVPYVALTLEPAFGSISLLSQQIDDAVRCLQKVTGTRPLVVAHSMGGLAVRFWLHQQAGDSRVARIVTIGTPHRGTWLGRFSGTMNVRQMAVNSDWIRSLSAASSVSRNALFTCFYSDCDNAVFPIENATLDGAQNRLISGAAHVDLAFRSEVLEEVIATVRLSSGSPEFV